MRRPDRFTTVALVALLAPAALLGAGAAASGALSDTSLAPNDWWFLFKTWAFFATPQLFVLAWTYLFAGSRSFALAALIALTALCTCLVCLVLFARDPNSGMFMVFYLPLSALVVLGALVFAWLRDPARGSNNRWRGP